MMTESYYEEKIVKEDICLSYNGGERSRSYVQFIMNSSNKRGEIKSIIVGLH